MRKILILILLPLIGLGQYRNVTKADPIKLFMNGNSIMGNNADNTVANVRYLSHTLYSNLLAANYRVSLFDYSTGGQTQPQINALKTRHINATNCNSNDIVVIWELTNHLGIDQSVTAQQAFDSLKVYVDYVKQFTDKYIVGTCMARDFAGDLVTLQPKIDAVNTLIRAEYSGYHLCDIGANTNFDTKADASISPPYKADKLHLVQAGADIVIGMIQTNVVYFLTH